MARTGTGGGRTGGVAHIGDFIDYVVTIDNTAPFNCDVTNATVVLTLPDGTAITVINGLTVLGNASPTGGNPADSKIICPGDVRACNEHNR